MNGFTFARYKIRISPLEDMYLPDFKGSTFRGGFGGVFRRIVCVAPRESCASCTVEDKCAYRFVFETSGAPDSLSATYDNAPRPFVFEPPETTRNHFAPGEAIEFHMTLFGRAVEYLPYFLLVFHALGEQGLGRGRARYDVLNAVSIGADGTESQVYDGKSRRVTQNTQVLSLEKFWADEPESLEQISLLLLTPVRIKFNGNLVERLEFHILVRNLLRRLTMLYAFQEAACPQIPYADVLEAARRVGIKSSDVRWYDWERYSSRQDTRMKLGGIVGNISYQGEIGEFMPLLRFGEIAHIGKSTTFGLGKYQIIM